MYSRHVACMLRGPKALICQAEPKVMGWLLGGKEALDTGMARATCGFVTATSVLYIRRSSFYVLWANTNEGIWAMRADVIIFEHSVELASNGALWQCAFSFGRYHIELRLQDWYPSCCKASPSWFLVFGDELPSIRTVGH